MKFQNICDVIFGQVRTIGDVIVFKKRRCLLSSLIKAKDEVIGLCYCSVDNIKWLNFSRFHDKSQNTNPNINKVRFQKGRRA